MAQVAFCSFLELSQHKSRDFRWSVFLPGNIDFHVVGVTTNDVVGDSLFFRLHFRVSASHEPLDGIDGVGRVRDGLAFCRVSDECFALVGVSNDAWCGPGPFLVGDHTGLASLHDRNHRVRCPQVDSDDFFTLHDCLLRFSVCDWVTPISSVVFGVICLPADSGFD